MLFASLEAKTHDQFLQLFYHHFNWNHLHHVIFFPVNIKIKNNAHYNFQIVLVNSLHVLFVAADILRLEMRLYASTHFVLV